MDREAIPVYIHDANNQHFDTSIRAKFAIEISNEYKIESFRVDM